MHERSERSCIRKPSAPSVAVAIYVAQTTVANKMERAATHAMRKLCGAQALSTHVMTRLQDAAAHSMRREALTACTPFSAYSCVRQADVDVQLKEQRRARALLASITLEQDGRQAHETMAACRQQLEARAKPCFP